MRKSNVFYAGCVVRGIPASVRKPNRPALPVRVIRFPAGCRTQPFERPQAQLQTYLIWTVPLVICLCLKYYLTIDGNSDGDPIEVIFQDKVLLALIAAFAILTVVLLYLV